MVVGYLLMVLVVFNLFYIGLMVVGVCYGVCLVIIVFMVLEFFGFKYYGFIYNILVFNLLFGSFFFFGFFVGFFYDVEVMLIFGGGNICVGVYCYCFIFLVMVLVFIIGVGLDILLVYSMKEIYVKIYVSKKVKSFGSDFS